VIIDVHGHYTTAPKGLAAYRKFQLAHQDEPAKRTLEVTDDEIRETIENGQLQMQRDRGTDVALFSPTAGGMAHHLGDAQISRYWTETVNELIYRVTSMFPENFVGVCQLPHRPASHRRTAWRSWSGP